MHSFSRLLAWGVALWCATGAQSQTQTILEVAAGAAEFSTLASIVSDIPDLVTKLDCAQLWCPTYTVFAPTNTAFAALPSALLSKLTSEPYDEHLRAVILYHMVRGRLLAQTILSAAQYQVQTEQGEFLTATSDGQGGVVINEEAQVIAADVMATNGVVHGIDAALVPSFLVTDIVGIAEDAGMFQTLLSLAVDAGVVEDLQAEGLTLFAPTDEAFSNVPQDVLDALLADPTGALRDVLLYHVVPSIIPRAKVTASSVTTAQGENLDLNWIGVKSGTFNLVSSIQVNSAVEVIQEDIFASNGIIHVIDEVLIPPSLVLTPGSVSDVVRDNPNLSALTSVLILTGLFDTLASDEPFTLLAPTDAAFEALGQETIDFLLGDLDALSNILLYHTFDATIRREALSDGIVTPLNGDNLLVKATRIGVTFNKFSDVQQFNIQASNGIVHIIDHVLTPPDTLVGTAASSSDFSTLVAAIQAAGLVDTLGGGPFTVFAPTDAAFDKLPDGLLDTLLADPEGALREILLYHVVGGNVLAADLSNGPVTTAQGEDIEVTLNYFQGSTFLSSVGLNGDSTTTSTDVVASNGIIHVIDTVLIPPSIANPGTPTAPTSTVSPVPPSVGPTRAPATVPPSVAPATTPEPTEPLAPPSVAPVATTPGPTNVTPGPVSPDPVTPAPVAPAPVTPAPVAPAPVTPAPVAPAPVTPAPVAPAPVTPSPVTPSPVTPAPVTPAPVTSAPIAPAPVTAAPITPAPITPAPVTPSPVTPAPVTPAPITPAPVTAAPITPAPITPAPVTPSPVTPAPVTPAPITPAPMEAPTAAPILPSTPFPTIGEGIVVPPPLGAACWISTSDITIKDITEFLTNPDFDDSVQRIYEICPNTNIVIGYLADPTSITVIGGVAPLIINNRNVKIRCGSDGSSSNNCVLRGGQEHVSSIFGTALLENVLPFLPFLVPGLSSYPTSLPEGYTGADSSGLIIEGLTFEQSGFFEIDTIPHSTMSFFGPGRGMLVKDCIFRNNGPGVAPSPGNAAITVSRLADFQLTPAPYSSLTIEDCVFENNVYRDHIIVTNYNGTNAQNDDPTQVELTIKETSFAGNTITGPIVFPSIVETTIHTTAIIQNSCFTNNDASGDATSLDSTMVSNLDGVAVYSNLFGSGNTVAAVGQCPDVADVTFDDAIENVVDTSCITFGAQSCPI